METGQPTMGQQPSEKAELRTGFSKRAFEEFKKYNYTVGSSGSLNYLMNVAHSLENGDLSPEDALRLDTLLRELLEKYPTRERT